MDSNASITQTPGNTPIKDIPPDYYPEGCGFWYELSEGLDAKKKLFFRDSTHGDGTPEKTIVFIHGNPENSYTYRKVINHLINSAKKPFRLVTMDHIGFGLSDQASFEMVCMDHANNLLQLINHLDLKDVTLIVHDWGGPIGIGAFLKVPERVSNLVVLNSTVFPIPETGLTYDTYPSKQVAWSSSPKMIPNNNWGDFAATIIFLTPMEPKDLLAYLMPTLREIGKGNYSPTEKTAQMLFKQQFSPEMNALSSKRLVLQTPIWGHGAKYNEPTLGERDTKPFYMFIQENISACWGPDSQNIGVRALCGKWDPSAKDEVMEQWIAHLPQLEGNITEFQEVSHFVEEHKPKEIAEAILEVSNLI